MYLADTTNTKMGKQFLQIIRDEVEAGNINITICYCSVYEQRWISEMIETEGNNEVMKSSSSRKIESCKTVPTSDI